jgi:hypothetical protein
LRWADSDALADAGGLELPLRSRSPRRGDTELRSRIHHLRGNLHFARGGRNAADERSLVLARESGSRVRRGDLGLADAAYAGRIVTMHGLFERCLAICGPTACCHADPESRDDRWCLRWRGDRTGDRARRAIKLAQRINDINAMVASKR